MRKNCMSYFSVNVSQPIIVLSNFFRWKSLLEFWESCGHSQRHTNCSFFLFFGLVRSPNTLKKEISLRLICGWTALWHLPLTYSTDSVFLSCQIRIFGRIYTLQLPECQGSPCSKQVWYLKYRYLNCFEQGVSWYSRNYRV